MKMHRTDQVFAGSIPQLYDSLLVPLIFRPYAADLTARIVSFAPRKVLEIAAGTGVVTRMLARALPPSTTIVATDLNQPMLDHAEAVGSFRPVTWQPADALDLPFDDGLFDLVVCQFGVMFFPDKAKAFAEARRVLMPGGKLLFNVWDRIEENEFAHTVTVTLATLFPAHPPAFLARTPHGYPDPARVEADLRAGGISGPLRCDTVTAQSHATDPTTPAIAYCHGTPLRVEIEALGPNALTQATDACTAALAARYGPGPLSGQIRAHVFSVST